MNQTIQSKYSSILRFTFDTEQAWEAKSSGQAQKHDYHIIEKFDAPPYLLIFKDSKYF